MINPISDWGRQRRGEAPLNENARLSGNAVPRGVEIALSFNLGDFRPSELEHIFPAVINVLSIIRTDQTAAVTTTRPHNLASGVMVTIADALETAYNIPAVITVTGLNTFQYQVVGTPNTPATPNPTITATFALGAKLALYAGLKGASASTFLAANALVITGAESDAIINWIDAYHLNRLADAWNHSEASILLDEERVPISFAELELTQQTALFSWQLEHEELASQVPDAWSYATDGDWAKVENFLQADNVNSSVRMAERNLLQSGF